MGDIDDGPISFWYNQDTPNTEDIDKKADWLVNAFSNYLKSQNFTYYNVRKNEEITYGKKTVYKKQGFWASIFDQGEEVTDYDKWNKWIKIFIEAKW